LFAWAGRTVIELLGFLGAIVLLHNRAIWGLLRGRAEYATTVTQMAHVGVNSLPIVAVTMLFSGLVLAYHGDIQASKMGATGLVGWLVAETVCRELGPVLGSIVVSARAGSAMTAELGTMKVTEQVDALRAMSVNPVDYLVVPRYLAAMIMVPILILIGNTAAVLGGYLLAIAVPYINDQAYLANIPGNLEIWTVMAGLLKSFAFAAIIVIVSCHQGLSCKMASEAVGEATTRSVVYCIILIYAANVVLTTILFPR
jgi:phospholipid/cholesterol/gamma-HCH transport system permease protein